MMTYPVPTMNQIRLAAERHAGVRLLVFRTSDTTYCAYDRDGTPREYIGIPAFKSWLDHQIKVCKVRVALCEMM